MSDWWPRARERLLCRLGHHDWSCDMSRRCMGLGDHYCRRCFVGLPEWMKKNSRSDTREEGDR